MYQQLSSWVNNKAKTYKEGLEIYRKVKKTEKFDAFLNQGDSFVPGSPQFTIMENELRRIARIMSENNVNLIKQAPEKPIISVKETPQANKTSRRPLIANHPTIDIRELPEELQVKYRENKNIYSEMKKLHGKLKDTAITDETRKNLADKLGSLASQDRENWEAIDTWFANKDKPQKPEPAPDKLKQVIDCKDNISNFENYVRRYRSQLEKPLDDKKKASAEKLLAKYQEKLTSEREILKSLTA
jgi:tellurite resistance-related uncharacterized protein